MLKEEQGKKLPKVFLLRFPFVGDQLTLVLFPCGKQYYANTKILIKKNIWQCQRYVILIFGYSDRPLPLNFLLKT